MPDTSASSYPSQARWDEIWENANISPWDDMCEGLLRVLLREAGDIEGKEILECGSGSGRVSLRMASRGAKITLLDKSPVALGVALRLSRQQSVSVDLVQSDIFSMPFPDAQFDMVWNAGVLEHFEGAEQIKILKEMKRVCKPGGDVVVIVPYAGNPLYRAAKWWSEKTGRWIYGRETPSITLTDTFSEAGLKVKREYEADFFDSINFLAAIPNSNTLKTLFHIWYDSLSENEQEELPGRWLVTVAKNQQAKSDLTQSEDPGPHLSSGSPPTYRRRFPSCEEMPRDIVTTTAGISTKREPPPIICLSSIRWDELYQRPQQIMSRLSELGHKVLFVNFAFQHIKSEQEFISPEALKTILDNSALESLSRKAQRLYTFNPLSQIECKGSIGAANKDTLLASILAACELLGVKEPVWWVLTPFWYKILEQLPLDFSVVYDCVDDHRYFAGVNPDTMERIEELTAKRANIILATAKQLHRKKASISNTLFLPNGVDFKAYQNVFTAVPEDLKNIPRPRLGFSGAISTWVDADLLFELARSRPDWHIVVIGSVYIDMSKFSDLPNFHYLGKKKPVSLPSYLQNFDVGLIPFKSEHPLVRSANPIKLYEYLASGIPIVSTKWDEVAEFKDVVSFAEGTKAFESVIESALSNPLPAESLRARAAAFDWNTISQIASHAIRLAVADSKGDGDSMERILGEIIDLERHILVAGGSENIYRGESFISYPDGLSTIRAYAKALGDRPDSAVFLLKRSFDSSALDRICEVGNRLYNRGLISRAIALLEKAVLEYDYDADIMYNLAALLAERDKDGDIKRAVTLLESVLENQPEDEGTRALLGYITALKVP